MGKASIIFRNALILLILTNLTIQLSKKQNSQQEYKRKSQHRISAYEQTIRCVIGMFLFSVGLLICFLGLKHIKILILFFGFSFGYTIILMIWNLMMMDGSILFLVTACVAGMSCSALFCFFPTYLGELISIGTGWQFASFIVLIMSVFTKYQLSTWISATIQILGIV